MDNTSTLQITLMEREASTRLSDAALLESDLHRESDSGHLLRLLAFELLLKAAAIIHNQKPSRNHKYIQIWQQLPLDLQKALVADAAYRMSGVSDYSDVNLLLSTWSANFVALRYPYEKYQGLSEDEYIKRGEEWIASGGPDEDADFVYYSVELRGVTEALHKVVRNALSNARDKSSA